MKPIDMLPDWKPTRKEEHLPNGNMRVTVTPPEFLGLPGKSVELMQYQYRRYRAWLSGSELIQDALSDLTLQQREILLNGDPDV